MTVKFYKKEDVQKLRFFQVPKVLLERDQYKKLGLAEKLVYGVLLDRTLLSMKNDWFDEDGYAYILFSGETLGDVLNVHEKTARKYVNNLKKFGLLEEKRMGRGMSNRIYLVQPDYIENDVYEKKEDENVENNEKEQKVPSKSNERLPLEGTKSSPNDTDFIDTDFIDIQSVEKDRLKQKHSYLCGQCQTYLFKDTKDIKLIENAIMDLMYLREVKVKNKVYNNEEIMDKLNQLDFNICDYALDKFKEAKDEIYIKNKARYFSILLFNAIDEYYFQ